jgi:hypothetical protein
MDAADTIGDFVYVDTIVSIAGWTSPSKQPPCHEDPGPMSLRVERVLQLSASFPAPEPKLRAET